jgi:predicted NBD/HSP70 family sugar kinase
MTDAPQTYSSRQHTLWTVISTALSEGQVSRADLARISGLSKQTMSEVFRELEDDGWLELAGHTKGNVGRSAAMYQLKATRALLFGADVGGTKIHAAVADVNGQILAETEVPTTQDGPEAVVRQLHDVCAQLASQVGQPMSRIAAGAVGIPGAFNPRTKKLFMVPNIAGLEGFAIAEELEKSLGFPVRVDNDVNMAAKGEMWRGEGRDIPCFVFVAIGTGIGMGIINDGRILSGANGAAGEIATLPVGGDPYDSRNFHAGTLETSVGSIALRERYEGRGGTAGQTVRTIIDAIEKGDTIAASTLTEVARSLAVAILAVSAVLDPQRIVLGGSIGVRAELLERIRAFMPMCIPNPPECVVSTLGRNAALLGTVSQSQDLLLQMLISTDPSSIAQA